MNGKMEKMEKMEPKAEKAEKAPMQPMMKAKAPAPMNYSGGKSNGGSCYDHGRKSSQ
jgi:hypothetical protein